MDTRLLYYLVGALLINIAYGNFDGHVRSHPLDSLHVSSYLNNDFPVHPFTRKLVYSNGSSPLQGKDVYILQNLLKRISSPYTGPINSQYDKATSIAVSELQRQVKLSSTGIFDAATAAALMNPKNGFIFDHHTDDGVTARSYGLKFKVLIVGHYNRSVESQAKLFDEDNNLLHTFIARTHGHSKFGPAPWPEFTNDVGLNEFSSSGNTVSGLSYLDLNSPEPDPKLYGKWNVLRVTTGIRGNSQFLLPNIRNGLLIHTGEWADHSSWRPGKPMPNSAGCIHIYPEDLQKIVRILEQRGVAVRENPFGKLPYPFKPQGLLSFVVKP